MANTTIKQCADAFEEKEEVLKILLRADKETFAEFAIVDDKTGEIELENRGLDRLEELISDKDKAKVLYQDIAEVLDVPVEDVASVVKKNDGKIFTRMTTKSADGKLEHTSIRCKELDTLVKRVLESKKQPAKISVKPKPTTKPKAASRQQPNVVQKECSQGECDDVNIGISKQMALTLSEDSVQEKQKPAEKKSRTSRKKKNNGVLTKEMVEGLGIRFEDAKALRMFMLTSLNFKPEEIALMSDSEIQDVFASRYILIETMNGMMVMEKDFVLQNLSHFLFIQKKQ